MCVCMLLQYPDSASTYAGMACTCVRNSQNFHPNHELPTSQLVNARTLNCPGPTAAQTFAQQLAAQGPLQTRYTARIA